MTLKTSCTSCDPTHDDVKHRAGHRHQQQTTQLTTVTLLLPRTGLMRDVWLR